MTKNVGFEILFLSVFQIYVGGKIKSSPMLDRFQGWRPRWLYITNNHLFTAGELLSASTERQTHISKILCPSIHLLLTASLACDLLFLPSG